ncbi:hypothetical protein [Bacteriovorax sp. DB6_IX]|uniref:hypothetical protein n=1 Tax=Bacteriovorax sp. DB6_IX TaxID=1353530 RepID=UPI000389FB48|nr:hypothetical protein [Bacteriovorax sp. DB6_IX]EQC50784.1 hypothetical protein M901_3127 [Bacteriovorax sp. DB6_IX]
MKVPTLEEIKLTSAEMSEIKNLLIKSKVGLAPKYTDLSHLGRERLNEILTILEIVFKDINIHPKFPYPFYIINGNTDVSSFFPVVKGFEDIPEYFQVEVKRVTNKEQKLLDKIEVICSQVHNENIENRLHEYKMNILPQKFIKSLAKEGLFLEKVLENLSED